jgi:hypothetical protein
VEIKTTQRNNIIRLKNCQDISMIDMVRKLVQDLESSIEESISMFLNNEIDLISLSEVFTEAISIFLPTYKLHDCSICGCIDREVYSNIRVSNDWLCESCWEKLLDVPVNQSLETYIEKEDDLDDESKDNEFDLDDESKDNEFNWGELFDKQVINNV